MGDPQRQSRHRQQTRATDNRHGDLFPNFLGVAWLTPGYFVRCADSWVGARATVYGARSRKFDDQMRPVAPTKGCFVTQAGASIDWFNGISDTELDTQVAAAIEKSQKALDSPVRAFPIAPWAPRFMASNSLSVAQAAYSSC